MTESLNPELEIQFLVKVLFKIKKYFECNSKLSHRNIHTYVTPNWFARI